MAEPQAKETVEVDDPYALDPKAIRESPTNVRSRLRFLGPGFVLVGSVVGSGEIILTTTLGSIVGFSMLWFVLLSCWSKNIIQVELARFSVASGEPFLHSTDCPESCPDSEGSAYPGNSGSGSFGPFRSFCRAEANTAEQDRPCTAHSPPSRPTGGRSLWP